MKLIKNQWEVKQIETAIAKGFVEKWHYSRRTSNTAVSCFGLYYKTSPELHGISWWMPPPLGAAKSVSGENHRTVLALSRFCLVDDRPENAGSFLISRSINMLDNRWNMLLTYADRALKHNGGLYRAANWNYNGLTRKNPVYWDTINNCMVSRKRGPRTYNHNEMLEMPGIKFLGKFKKHRFIYPLQNRGGIIVNPKRIEPDEEPEELTFIKNGKIYINKKKKNDE